MSVLASVEEFIVPLELVEQTLEPLHEAGSQGYEAFVLWGGTVTEDGKRLDFASAFFPAQTTSRGEAGLLVVVDGDALFRANRAFYERDQIVAGQVHSHPTDAYHSSTDDDFPLMTLVGGLSAVVPNFGAAGLEGVDDWAWYRLADTGEWMPLGSGTGLRFVG